MGTVTVTVMMMSSTVVVLTHDCGFLKGLRATVDGRKRRRGGGLPERSSLAGWVDGNGLEVIRERWRRRRSAEYFAAVVPTKWEGRTNGRRGWGGRRWFRRDFPSGFRIRRCGQVDKKFVF